MGGWSLVKRDGGITSTDFHLGKLDCNIQSNPHGNNLGLSQCCSALTYLTWISQSSRLQPLHPVLRNISEGWFAPLGDFLRFFVFHDPTRQEVETLRVWNPVPDYLWCTFVLNWGCVCVETCGETGSLPLMWVTGHGVPFRCAEISAPRRDNSWLGAILFHKEVLYTVDIKLNQFCLHFLFDLVSPFYVERAFFFAGVGFFSIKAAQWRTEPWVCMTGRTSLPHFPVPFFHT